MKRQKKHHYLGFTLVELIIVITILAILASIAFISFKNYAGNSRDSSRLTTLSNLQTGLELYQVKTSNYPIPDEVYGTGVYENNGEEIELNYVGLIKDGIPRVISMNKTPLDPKTNDNYTYGISYNHKYYQVATVLENNLSYSVFPTTYANSNYQAKVNGNYGGLITKGNTIYNIPSLIFNNKGKVLLTGSVYFIADKSDNLPYTIDGNTTTQNSDSQKVLQLVTRKPSLHVIGVEVPQTTTQFESNTGTYSQLGYNLNTVGKTIFGETYEGNFPEETINNNNPTLESCTFGDGNTSGSIFGECSL